MNRDCELGAEAPVLTVGIPCPARWCSLAFWASKYSLKGFCSAAPSSGTALPPPTQRGVRREGGRKRGKGGKEGGKEEGEGEGMGGTNHVTSLLLTSPRAATKGGMPSYLLYGVGLPYFLSPRREKDGESNECDPFTAHPHTHAHKHTHRKKYRLYRNYRK